MTTQTTTLPTLCQQMVADPDRYAILDCETTSLDGEIIDLAIVSLDGKALFNELLRPTVPIEEGAMAVHEITEAMVATVRTFKEAWPDILVVVEGKTIIAYNATFDRGRFEHTARVHGITLPILEWQCMMLRYAEFWGMPGRYGGFRWQKLKDACLQQGIPFNQAHRALSDAHAVVKLIQKLAG
jgi:DNA polymerase III subunit epsilon